MVLGEPVGWTEWIGDLGAGERKLGTGHVQRRGVVERGRRSGNRTRCPWRWWRGEAPGPRGRNVLGAQSGGRSCCCCENKGSRGGKRFHRKPSAPSTTKWTTPGDQLTTSGRGLFRLIHHNRAPCAE